MLFDYLVISQIVPVNPAAPVKGPTHVVKRGKTPVLSVEDARTLLDSISSRFPAGFAGPGPGRRHALFVCEGFGCPWDGGVGFLRKRTPALVPAVKKGGKHHEVPVHHKAQDYVAEYLEKAGFEPNKPLFQTFYKKQSTGRPMSRSEAYRMIRRRAIAPAYPLRCAAIRSEPPGLLFTWKTTEHSKRLRRSRRMRALARRSYTIGLMTS